MNKVVRDTRPVWRNSLACNMCDIVSWKSMGTNSQYFSDDL